MANISQALEQRINETESRYRGQQETLQSNQAALARSGDWTRVENPQRVLRRMMALGLRNLAARAMVSGDVTQTFESQTHPGRQVNLLERVIEENDLLESRFLHNGSEAARAVGRILIRERGRTVGYGTGFLVSPRLIMTNNHVLQDTQGAAQSLIEFDYYERRTGQSGPSAAYLLEPHRFFLTDSGLDFTLVAVAEQSQNGVPISDRGWLTLLPESGKALVGEAVNIIQHPGGDPQRVVLKNNHITNLVDDFLHYVADTEPGSSGSPVLNMQWELAALHHSGVPERDQQGRILLQDGSPWNGNQFDIHRIRWTANEGVRISSIVASVRQSLGNESSPTRDLFEAAVGETPTGRGLSARGPAIAISSRPVAAPATELDDEALDRLTPEEVAEIVAQREDQSLETGTRLALLETERRDVLVAQGDSWFDYSPAGLDIVSCLRTFFGYQIHNVSDAGDTLDNMAWGTKYNRNWHRDSYPLERTLEAVSLYQPRAVLLSGGGNDIAGDELLSFLNHKSSGLDWLRQPYTDFVISDYFKKALQHIMDRVWQVNNNAHILLHGYGHGIPDGRGVIRIFGFSFVGPWLRPALTAKGYVEVEEREQITRQLIDLFNEMLQSLAAGDSGGRVHYLDLRGDIGRDDWGNELHLKNSGYRRIAAKFDAVLRSIP